MMLITDNKNFIFDPTLRLHSDLSERVRNFHRSSIHTIIMTISTPTKIIVACFAVAALVAAAMSGGKESTGLKGSARKLQGFKIVDGQVVNSQPVPAKSTSIFGPTPVTPASNFITTFKSNAPSFLAGKTTFADTLEEPAATLFSKPGSGTARSNSTATKLATSLSTKPGDGKFITNAKASNALPIVTKDFVFGGSTTVAPAAPIVINKDFVFSP